MEEYPTDGMGEPPPPAEEALRYFCQLTFGQFFTLVVLLVMTLCFSFYLGARYGNQYLRLGEAPPPQMATTPALQGPAGPLPDAVRADEQLKQLAREALMAQQRGKLEGQVQELLKSPTPPAPTTTAIAPPPAVEGEETTGAQQANTTPPSAPSIVAEGRAAPAETPVKVKSSGGMPYAVQVGAYQDQREAAYYVEEWKAKGYAAYLMTADLGDRGFWYRVRLGAFPTKPDAERYLGELKSKESVDAIIVQNEP